MANRVCMFNCVSGQLTEADMRQDFNELLFGMLDRCMLANPSPPPMRL